MKVGHDVQQNEDDILHLVEDDKILCEDKLIINLYDIKIAALTS